MRQLWEEIMRAKIGLLSLALLALGIGQAGAEPVKIRVAWVAPVANWVSIWLDKKDLAKHFGQSYIFEPVHFAGTPPMVTAIANNEVEIGDLAYSTLPIAIKNAGMDDIRIIADDFQDGVGDNWTIRYTVLTDGPIKKIEDLKGKVVASNAIGSGVDIAMRAMLHKHGLEDKRDYSVIEAPFPTMRAILAEKKADLVSAVLPFALDPALRGVARPLFAAKDAVGVSEFTMWTARKDYIAKNRAALVDFMEDALTILRWYLDPANHEAAVDIFARVTKQPRERLGWAYTDKDYFRDPNLLPNISALQRNVDLTHELGFIKASVDVAKQSDLSLVQEAAKRLK
jgi:NitT/TauT family transport system substrate-binding protein